MRITFKTKKRNLVVATGEDAADPGTVEWVQMVGGDFQPAPVEEWVYEEEEEDSTVAAKAAHSFGLAPRQAP